MLVQPSSLSALNPRSVSVVMPVGSTEPGGGGGGAAVTVTAAVPLTLSLVAVIVALPATNALTRPDDETLATAGLLEAQLTARPVNVLLLASRVTAESCTVEPTCTEGADGLTETDATGAGAAAGTVIADDPLLPSLVAVIVAVPAATPVTTPEAETLATPEELELQVTARPVRTVLFASRVTADSWTVAPICTDEEAGLTDTDATGAGAGAGTVIVEVPVWPSLLAVMVAVPAETAVTTPDVETLAIALELELHVTTRPVRMLPFASRVVADNATVAPVWMVAEAGETDTEATGTGAGALTVIGDEELCPSLVAVIDEVPAPTVCTSPAAFTVATLVVELVQTMLRPVRTLPLESLRVAVACAV